MEKSIIIITRQDTKKSLQDISRLSLLQLEFFVVNIFTANGKNFPFFFQYMLTPLRASKQTNITEQGQEWTYGH